MHTQKHLNYINGKWAEPSTGEYYKNYNPADENQVLGEFPLSGEKDADAAVAAAQAAFESWSTLLPNERVRYFQKLTDLLVENRDRIGEAICLEEGKTWKEAISEPTRGAIEVSFFTGEGQRMEGITMPSTRKGVTSLAMRVPLGVVAAIAPWNFPFLTPLRKVIPALVMGNTVVFKPASDTPMSAVLLAEMFEKAGFPQGVFNMVIGRGTEIGDAICANPLVRGITFTGSTVVGRHINEVAAHHFAKVQLEMGGKNPAIVADYKDLPAAARQLSNAAFALAGQRCTAISRIIVTEDIADQLENLIAAEMSKLIVGPGTDSKTNVCPIINRSAGKKIMQFIEGARADGATIMVGGKQLKGGDYDKGMYIEPTLITNVPMKIGILGCSFGVHHVKWQVIFWLACAMPAKCHSRSACIKPMATIRLKKYIHKLLDLGKCRNAVKKIWPLCIGKIACPQDILTQLCLMSSWNIRGISLKR